MTRRFAALFLALGLLLGLASTAHAQDGTEGEVRIEETYLGSHPEVALTVSLPSALGTELDGSAFTVTENGEVRDAFAQALAADDVQVVLVLDASTSMQGAPLTASKEAATRFLEVLPSSVEVAVVSFASTTSVLSEFTTDRATSASAIQGIVVAGETALYDGVIEGAGLFAQSAPDTRRTMVLLSDGGDTISEALISDAIRDVLVGDITFYAVELQSPENDGAAIAEIAAATDGTVVPAEDPAALAGVFEAVASQIANRYVLTYTSESYDAIDLGVSVEAEGVSFTAVESVQLPAAPPPIVEVPPEPVNPAPVEPVAPPVDPMALRDGDVVSLAWYQSSRALILGAGAVFLATAALMFLVGINRRKREVRYSGAFSVAESMKAKKGTALKSLAQGATSLAERSLKSEKAKGLNAVLEKAGIAMRPAEFVVMAASVALGALAIGFVFAGLLVGATLAVVVMLVFRMRLSSKAKKRGKMFGEQLPDALQLMAGSLRAGFGFMQAISTVGNEVNAPCGEEFRRVRIESQLGKDVDEALAEMADRVDSEDFKWIVEAIQIHREVGGDLAEILDTVTDTIRDRNAIRRRISALSAEGKISGAVLGGLPFALAIIVNILNPEYLVELTESALGIAMIVGGLVAMGVGIFWMRRITALKF